MKKLLITSIYISLINIFLMAQNAPYDPKVMETENMKIHLTNVGILDWYCYGEGEIAINWIDGKYPLVWNHGIYLTGLIGDSIVGSIADYCITYSPGPVIDGQAAMQVAPEDSQLYRVYGLRNDTSPVNFDYQQWPIQWGAPHYPDGTPKILGDVTYYTVYNDVDTRPEYQGLDYLCAPSPFEIRETVWGYLTDENWLGNVLFLKYQIYNRGPDDIHDMTFGMRTDIDIGYWVEQNWGGYNPDNDYMYVYYYGTEGTNYVSPKACAYCILQGPCVDTPDSMGFEFGKWHQNKRNLPTTFGWYIFNESTYTDSQYLATAPANLEEFRNVALGLKRDGSQIINPTTGKTTTFTYDGDPLSGEGWLWDINTPQGGVGFIIGCSTFDLPSGDSTEVVLALIVGEGNTGLKSVANLNNTVPQVREFWQDQISTTSVDNFNTEIPEDFILLPAHPNPFNSSTMISFLINEERKIKINVYNINGKLIDIIYNKICNKGLNNFIWNANNYSSGQYFILINNKSIHSQKVTLIK